MNGQRSDQMEMICISRDFRSITNPFTVERVKGKTAKVCWEIVEEGIMTNDSQDWLISKKEAMVLIGLLYNKLMGD